MNNTIFVQVKLSRAYRLVKKSLLAVFSTLALSFLGTEASIAAQPLAGGQLLVSSRSNSSILRYDARTGAFIDTFVQQQSGGLNGPHSMLQMPDGNFLVSSIESHQILRYNGRNGEFMNVFASGGGLSRPHGMALGPDGDLYVAGFASNRIYHFNGQSGAFIRPFADGVDSPLSLVFGPDHNIYVTSFTDHSVARFNPQTGKLINKFVSSRSGGLYKPLDLTFGPDGDLYVSQRDGDNILRYNGATGAFKGIFVSAKSGGLDSPEGLIFGPDGDLYVCSLLTDSVLRYNGITGAFKEVFIESGSGGLDGPSMLYYIPTSPLNATLAAHIEPVSPFTTDNLRCVTEFDNIGGYTDLDWSFRWFRNGFELLEGMLVSGDYLPVTGPELSHYFTAKNETFYCTVHVTDGTSSLTVHTDPVTIQNSPPAAPTVEIRPAEPRPGQDLGINILNYSTDPDGDEVDYRIEWYESENGGASWIYKREFKDHAFISGIYLQQGDLWRVVVTPFEMPVSPGKPGQALVEGESGWDQVYVGENSRPTIIVESPGSGDLVAAPGALIKWSAVDADGDPLRVELYYDTDTVKGGGALIASDLPASGALNWTPPGQKPAASFSDLNKDGSVNHADLFQMAARWQDSVDGARYHIFARVWDAKNAYGESFSPGEVVAPPESAAVNAGLLTLIGQWHMEE